MTFVPVETLEQVVNVALAPDAAGVGERDSIGQSPELRKDS